jgi:hypothetical protein
LKCIEGKEQNRGLAEKDKKTTTINNNNNLQKQKQAEEEEKGMHHLEANLLQME